MTTHRAPTRRRPGSGRSSPSAAGEARRATHRYLRGRQDPGLSPGTGHRADTLGEVAGIAHRPHRATGSPPRAVLSARTADNYRQDARTPGRPGRPELASRSRVVLSCYGTT